MSRIKEIYVSLLVDGTISSNLGSTGLFGPSSLKEKKKNFAWREYQSDTQVAQRRKGMNTSRRSSMGKKCYWLRKWCFQRNQEKNYFTHLVVNDAWNQFDMLLILHSVKGKYRFLLQSGKFQNCSKKVLKVHEMWRKYIWSCEWDQLKIRKNIKNKILANLKSVWCKSKAISYKIAQNLIAISKCTNKSSLASENIRPVFFCLELNTYAKLDLFVSRLCQHP